jgi:hypothetical protein
MPWNGRPVGADEVPGFKRALGLVIADLARSWPQTTTAPVLELEILHDDHAGDGVSVRLPDRAWHANGGIPLDRYLNSGPDPVAAIAEAAQETIMEFEKVVWPICATHGRGLHPRPRAHSQDEDYAAAGPAAWWCSAGGGHPLGDVGGLGSADE